MTVSMTELRRLPLHDRHVLRGARFTEFAGWQVPLSYAGIVEEHRVVRSRAGLFDVSHMGKFRVRGRGAHSFLERVLSNGLRKIGPGRGLYSLLLNERGGVLDDVIVYELDPEHFFMIVNAATCEKDFRWLEAHAEAGVKLVDESGEKGILALQGPASESILAEVFGVEVAALPPFRFRPLRVAGGEVLVTATGYTGERGFELVMPERQAAPIFEDLFEAGEPRGLVPAGFGARDTLRLEVAYRLYGQDMDEGTTPLEAGLERACDFSKDFIGKEALVRQKGAGCARRLAGFELIETGIARHGYAVLSEGRRVGRVTSGSYSPTLEKSVGLAYVPWRLGEPGSSFEVEVRGRGVKARAVEMPFYRRK